MSLPPPAPSIPGAMVAVLPMINDTNDLDGPVFVREAFNKVLPSRYYGTMDLQSVDRMLNEKMGITLGEQLDYTNPGAGAPQPKAVCDALMVDGIFYGRLSEFKQVITGFYNKRQVKVSFRLVNCRTEEVMWEKEEQHTASEMTTDVDKAVKSAASEVIGTVITKTFKVNPLKKEMDVVIGRLRVTIPPGPIVTK